MKNLIQELKESAQDFEFYPTTDQIIEILYSDLNGMARSEGRGKTRFDLLEIGCGNGKIFKTLEKLANEEALIRQKETNRNYGFACLGEKYGIEKSEILINQLPADVCIVGTDFWEQTLIDKKCDVIFSNPPYTQFAEWSVKIIKESYAKSIYLVIPQRWEDNKEIKEALRLRNTRVESLGDFDFLEADRQARAKVQLLRIDLDVKENGYDRRKEPKDPFDIWFENEFKINCDKKENYQSTREKEEKETSERTDAIQQEIATGRDLVQVLAGLYQRDLGKLILTYKKLEQLDSEIMQELEVNLRQIKENLKGKINGLKRIYWNEIFQRLDKIKERLCRKQRQKLLDSLDFSIDFTESNVYAVVVWVIKNANKYFNEQLVDLYTELSELENMRNYKSNLKVWEKDGWRFRQQEKSHYALDYRMIYSRGNWGTGFTWECQQPSRDTIGLVEDLATVATNLGFDGQSILSFGLGSVEAGKKIEIRMRPNWKNDNCVPNRTFAELRFYKNGNVHMKVDKDFMKCFNVEASRLLGWIKSPQEAAEEFPEDCKVSFKEAQQYFQSTFALTGSAQLLLN
jgi:hypothetical protein